MASKQQETSEDPIPKFTIVHPPDSTPLKSVDLISEIALPTELVEAFNRAFFFHFLATDPSRVIPPGKSLTSVLSRPNTQSNASERPTLKEQVETVVHRAFWDEVLHSLCDPAPSVQLSRLKTLYEDLHLALGPLLPPNHPVIATLSSPLSPTSSPLLSAVAHLREALHSLRERCAPIRDESIDALMRKLDDPPTSQLPHVVVDVVRSIHKVSDIMKDDLSQVTLGSMGERQLKALVSSQAKEEERELVVSLWGLPRIQSSWKAWLGEVDPHTSAPSPGFVHRTWVSRLLKALTTNAPVSCDIPTYSIEVSEEEGSKGVPLSDPVPTKDTSPNPLPPPLFFVTPALRKIQDYLQALVIAASLRSLIRLPPTNLHANQGPPEFDLIQRVWTLLRAEIEGEEGADGVKLENLADEIIRIRQRVGGTLEPEEEARLRAAVDRTVQPRDSVFILLHKRLSEALSERLTTASPTPTTVQAEAAPRILQTGRRARGPPHMELDGGEQSAPVSRSEEKPLVVRGFDDPVLIEATTDVLKRLGQCVGWTESVWRDVVLHI